MKLLSLFFLLFWTSQIQFIPGTFVHKGNRAKLTLSLYADSTFIYEKPMVAFKSTMKEKGTWEISQSTLILKDSIKVSHSKSAVKSQKIEKNNFVIIKFMDESQNPLMNWDVSLNDDDNNSKKTDNFGQVIFNYEEIKKRRFNQPERTVEIITLKKSNIERSLVIENIFDNQITIIHDFNPTVSYKNRRRNIEIVNDTLIFKNPFDINPRQEFKFSRQKD